MFTNSDLIFASLMGLMLIVLFHQATRPSLGPPLHPMPASWDPEPKSASRTNEQQEEHSTLPPDEFLTLRSPYNEQEIVNLVVELYELLVELCYFPHADIAWPPQLKGHHINEVICEELGLATEVVRLMRRIPYPRDSYLAKDFELFPWSRVFVYVEDEELRNGRDPDNYGEECRLDYIKKTDLALCSGTRDGMSVVLDTVENTIRCMDMTMQIWQPFRPEDAELERPDKPDYYRNLPGQHAPSFLRWYINRIRTLDLIPSAADVPTGWYGDIESKELQVVMKRVLEDKYGWPDSFQREKWRENMEDEWNRAWKDGQST